MMIVDLLLTLVLMLVLVFGVDEVSLWRLVMYLSAATAVLVLVHYTVGASLDALVAKLLKGGRVRTLPTRRKLMRTWALKTRREMELEKMDTQQLRQHLERRPKDTLALEILAERLKQAGRLADYARETLYLLTLKTDLTIEEQCSRYHEVAQIYIDRLGRPDRAAEVLHALIAHHPHHYQATLARRRLAQLQHRLGEHDTPSATP